MPVATPSYLSALPVLLASVSASSHSSKCFLTRSVLSLYSVPASHCCSFAHSHNNILPSMLPVLQPALSAPRSLHCCADSLSPQFQPTALTTVLQATLLRTKLLQPLLSSTLSMAVEVPQSPFLSARLSSDNALIAHLPSPRPSDAQLHALSC